MEKIIADLHLHTVASSHAYSTIKDYVEQAKNVGIKILGITDHACMMPGACDDYYFYNLHVVPRYIDGILVIRGIEANIIDYNGNLDINKRHYESLDLIIGSFHQNILKSSSIKDNTNAFVEMIKSGKVDIVGHSANKGIQVDMDEILKAARDYNVAIELNNATLKYPTRAGSEGIVIETLEKAYKYNNILVLNSDAHIHTDLGEFSSSYKIFQSSGFDILSLTNTDYKKTIDFFHSRGKLGDIIND